MILQLYAQGDLTYGKTAVTERHEGRSHEWHEGNSCTFTKVPTAYSKTEKCSKVKGKDKMNNMRTAKEKKLNKINR